MSRRERLMELDGRVRERARAVRVLSSLGWPAELGDRFLEGWRAGRAQLPEAPEVAGPHPEVAAALDEVLGELDDSDPAQGYLARVARSARDGARMLDAAGTPRFTELGLSLYGRPDDPVVPGGPSALDEARHLLHHTEGLPTAEPECRYDAHRAAERMRELVAPHLDDLDVELAPGLASLATAGSKRIRLRAGAEFTERQLQQFLQHEALVHSLTKRNGRRQSALRTLGISSAYTTATQEGLATLAELITDVLDLSRLRRVALRVVAVQDAIEGADFIEVFHRFLEGGQEPGEAYASTRRVFRGGDPRGGACFPKDAVYLRGLAHVHAFLLAALRAQRTDLVHMLFVGRVTPHDAMALCDDPDVDPPAELPPWVEASSCLAAYLAWAGFPGRARTLSVSLAAFQVAP